jgi:hypothetical protein
LRTSRERLARLDKQAARLHRAPFVTTLLFFYAFPGYSFVLVVNKPHDQEQARQANNEQQQLYCGTFV